MSLLLGKQVEITNTRLLRFAKEKGLKDLSQFDALDIIDMMELIAYCSDIDIKDLEDALDEDLAFGQDMAKCITDSYESGKKPKPKPLRKSR